MGRIEVLAAGVVLVAGGLLPPAFTGAPAGAAGAVTVATTAEFADAFFDPATTEITLAADVQVLDHTYRTLAASPLTIEGDGHTIELGPKGTLTDFGYSDLTLRDATVTAPGATSPDVAGGRGIRWRQGALTLDTVTVTDAVGTPVSIDGGTLTVTDSDFTGNRATPVRAISLAQASILRSTFSDNDSGDTTTGAGAGYGGAIYVDGTSAVTVVDSAFDDNHARVAGGAIFGLVGGAPYGSAITVVGSSFHGNDAPGGGAIVGDKVSLTNATVTGNAATGPEGAGGVTASRLAVRYSTIVANGGPVAANVLAVDEPTPTVAAQADWYASVVGEPGGGGANCAIAPGSAPEPTTSAYAVEGGGDSCGFSDATDRTDVVDLGLLPLATRAAARSVRIPAGDSTLVDLVPIGACLPPGAVGGPFPDQRGVWRPQGDGCDVGAVERQASDPSPPAPPTTPTSVAPPTAPTTTPSARPAAAAPATPIPGRATYTG